MKKIISALLCVMLVFAFAISCAGKSGMTDGGAYGEGSGGNQGITPGTMTGYDGDLFAFCFFFLRGEQG